MQGGAGQGWAFPTEPNKRTHSLTQGLCSGFGAQAAGLGGIQASYGLPCSRGAPEPRNLGVVGGKGVSALLSREPPVTAAGWAGGPRAPWTSGGNST